LGVKANIQNILANEHTCTSEPGKQTQGGQNTEATSSKHLSQFRRFWQTSTPFCSEYVVNSKFIKFMT